MSRHGYAVHCARCGHAWHVVGVTLPTDVERFVAIMRDAIAAGCPGCGAHGDGVVLCGPGDAPRPLRLAPALHAQLAARARRLGLSVDAYAGRLLDALVLEPADGAPSSILCPRCGRRSYHPTDVAERYCGGCHRFHDEPDLPRP